MAGDTTPPPQKKTSTLRTKGQLANHIRIAKGKITRNIHKARDILLLTQNSPPTDFIRINLEKAEQDLEDSLEAIEDFYDEIAVVDPVNQLQYATNCSEQHDRVRKIFAPLRDAVVQCTTQLDLKATSPAALTPDPKNIVNLPADTAKGPIKPNLALKPEPLSRGATPVEFRSFMKRFLAYFDSSNMSTLDQSVQFQYCIAA